MEHSFDFDDENVHGGSCCCETSIAVKSPIKRRLDFGAAIEDSDIRNTELNLLLEYAFTTILVPDDDIHEDGSTKISSRAKKLIKSNNNNSKPAAVWIEAEAGVGKSTLLQQFRSKIIQLQGGGQHSNNNNGRNRAIVIQGKFEPRTAASEPFAALRQVIQDLATQNSIFLTTFPENNDNAFRKQWVDTLRDEINKYGAFRLFLEILPELRPCFEPNVNAAGTEESDDGEHAKGYDDDDDDQNPFGDFNSREYRFEQFRVSFRNMVRWTCRHLWSNGNGCSLVIVLDDWHWVDPDSMQIVKTLMEDPQKPHNLRLIAATRPLVDYPKVLHFYNGLTVPTKPVSESTEGLKSIAASQREEKRARNESWRRGSESTNATNRRESHLSEVSVSTVERGSSTLEMMHLSKLSTPQIADFLHNLLSGASPETSSDDTYQSRIRRLATIVKEKTQGNTFVMVQFLRLVERRNFFVYDEGSQHWNFEISKIDDLEFEAENVSNVVTEMILSGSKRRRSALMAAASFGVSNFDVNTISHASKIVQADMDISESTTDDVSYDDPMTVKSRMTRMNEQLAEALNDGFIEQTESGNFRFAHDRIRESAYSLLPTGSDRKKLHLKVGRQLRAWMDTQEELGLVQSGFSKESLLLHATKQLNLGAELIEDDWELMDLVDLNYNAARLAARKTSFVSAVEYLVIGIQHLGGDAGWEEQYDRMLNLHLALARMQMSCGLLEDSWTTSDAIIKHGRSFKDKELIYRTRVLCLQTNDMLDDALELVLDVLDMMGEPVPRKFVLAHAIRGVLKARNFLNHISDDELLNLPLKREEHLETLLDFLQYLIEVAFLLRRSDYFLYCAMRIINLIPENGNYGRSFLATMFWSCYFKARMSDFSGAMQYGELSNKLAGKVKTEYPGYVARSDEMFYGHVFHWLHSYRESLPWTMDAFQRLWDSGSLDTAMCDAATLLQNFFVAGEPLQTIDSICNNYSEAFVDFQQLTHWYTNAPEHHAVKNFLGYSETPSVLLGEVIDSNVTQKVWERSVTAVAYFNFHFWSMIVAYHFCDVQKAKEHVKAMQGNENKDIPNFLSPMRPLYTGLTYFHLCRQGGQCGQRKYSRRAMSCLKALQALVKRGAVNCVYMCKILEAEHLGSSLKLDAAMKKYEEAITSVTELSLVHHIALTYQLAGECLVRNLQSSRARPYVLAAITNYEKWGATAIVKDLKLRYPHLLQPET